MTMTTKYQRLTPTLAKATTIGLRAMSGAGKTTYKSPTGYDALRVVTWADQFPPQLQLDYGQLVDLIDQLEISPAELTQLVGQACQSMLGDANTKTNTALNPTDNGGVQREREREREIIADVRSKLHKLTFYRRLGPGEPELFKWLFGTANNDKDKNKGNPNVATATATLPFVVVEARVTEVGAGGTVHLELLHLEETMRQLQLQSGKEELNPMVTAPSESCAVDAVSKPVQTHPTSSNRTRNTTTRSGSNSYVEVEVEGVDVWGHGNLPVAAMRALQLAQARLLQSQSPSQDVADEDGDDNAPQTNVSVSVNNAQAQAQAQKLLPELKPAPVPVALDTGTDDGVSIVAVGTAGTTSVGVGNTNDTRDKDSDNVVRVTSATSSTPAIKVRGILSPAEQIRQWQYGQGHGQGRNEHAGQDHYALEVGQHLWVAVNSCEGRPTSTSTSAFSSRNNGVSPLIWHASHRSPDVVAGLLRQYVPAFGFAPRRQPEPNRNAQPQRSSQQAEAGAEAKLEIVDIAREAGRLCKVAVSAARVGAGPHSNPRNKGKSKGNNQAFARVLDGLDLQPVLDRLPTGEQLILVEWSADALRYQANALNWRFWSNSNSNSNYSEHHQHHYQHANNSGGSLGGLRLTCEPQTEDGVGVARVQVEVEQARDIGRLIGRGGVNVRLAEQLAQCHYKFVVDTGTGTGTGTSNNVGVDQTQPQAQTQPQSRNGRRRRRRHNRHQD